MSKVYVTQELGETIKSIRLQKKVRSKDLANKINKSPAYVTKLEKGEIQTLQIDELNTIFEYIVGSDTSFDETIKEIYSILKFNYTDEEIEEQVWFSNYDTVKRKLPIPESLIDEFNNRLNNTKKTRKYLLSRINSNESLSIEDKENKNIPFNQWYSSDGKPKGAQSIKIKMSETLINDILNKTVDVTKYIYILSIAYYLIKIEKFEEIVQISSDDEKEIMSAATDLLSKHKFYSLVSKDKALETANSYEEQLQLLSSFDKRNVELVNLILKKIKFISDNDVKTTNKLLESFNKNLEWDLGFTLSLVSLDFFKIGNKKYGLKKELFDKTENLLKEYIEISDERFLIEKY
jgi:transcriptional regulator with XRE-family HTH domain